MKSTIIMVTVFIILSLAVYNAWRDKTEMHTHEEFFEQMLEFKRQVNAFKNKGRRNTADQGFALCLRLNELEIAQGKEPKNCEAIYD